MDANKLGVALGATLWLTGCGYIGEPLYPALNIPKGSVDLTAIERGDNLEVNFTIPPLNTEGLVIGRIAGLELRVGPNTSAPFNADRWAAAATRIDVPVPGKIGPVHVTFPAQPFIGQDVVVAVRSFSTRGRVSDWSNLATLTVQPPVATPAELMTEVDAGGVLLKWKPLQVASDGTSFRVFRKASNEPRPSQVGAATEAQYLDTTAEFGTRYEYWVEGVRGYAESELAGPVAVTPEDKFPPAVPSGLAVSAGLHTIELAWDRNTEADFKGYRVYRRTGYGTAPEGYEKVAELIEAPSFSDNKIEAGKLYRYAVSAVDQSGNESQKSDPVEIAAP